MKYEEEKKPINIENITKKINKPSNTILIKDLNRSIADINKIIEKEKNEKKDNNLVDEKTQKEISELEKKKINLIKDPKQISKVFEKYDVDNQGSLNIFDMKLLLKELGFFLF
jgi:DNA-binding transcriptional MerR regulator